MLHRFLRGLLLGRLGALCYRVLAQRQAVEQQKSAHVSGTPLRLNFFDAKTSNETENTAMKEALKTLQTEIAMILGTAEPGSKKAAMAAVLMDNIQLIAAQIRNLEKMDDADAKSEDAKRGQ